MDFDFLILGFATKILVIASIKLGSKININDICTMVLCSDKHVTNALRSLDLTFSSERIIKPVMVSVLLRTSIRGSNGYHGEYGISAVVKFGSKAKGILLVRQWVRW